MYILMLLLSPKNPTQTFPQPPAKTSARCTVFIGNYFIHFFLVKYCNILICNTVFTTTFLSKYFR